ncbi:MAG TPA: flagellar basal-body MS-ring/collar protein FliF [Stellaceae bacterium]|nr:flagellar basal-body MS-ring/collar protein FliF [Stellaceae bacterium]
MLTGGPRNLVLAGAALAVAAMLVGVLWSWNSSYAVLYAGLSAEEGGQAISDLQKLNIPYRTAEGGRVILVPNDELGRARLELALRGVPKRDGDQWALLDNESLGASPFVEQVHYTRAIESALSHTIRQIDGVVGATVKLALPKNTDFLGDEPKPSASVMVQLMPGVELTAAQVDGIAGLVAAGVPGLTRDRVTIVDQSGKVLSQDAQDGLQQVPQQLGIVRDVEGRYARAISQLLVPILGQGNFRVSVDADIDFSHAKESSIRYGSGHILSQDETIHPVGAAGAAAIGIPGALSNRPPQPPSVAPPAANDANAGQQSADEKPAKPAPPTPDTHRTTNFDLDHTVEYRDDPFWTLRAIDVAVLVNHPPQKPLAADMIASIKTLVASTVGAGQNRRIAVVDLPFDGLPETAIVGPAAWWTNPWVAAVAQNAMLALGGLALLFGGLSPLRRWLDASHLAMRQHGSISPAAIAAAVAAGGEPRAGPRLVAGTAFRPPPVDADPETVRNLVISEPDRTAQVIKEWIARDRFRLKQAG